MDISAAGLAVIKKWEGLRKRAYLCPAGVWTIGYGTTHGVRKGQRCTEEQAEEWLRRDCAKFEDAIEDALCVRVTQNQFDALVSFTYNVGPGAFRQSTLLKLLNRGEIEAAAQQFKRWNKSGGKVLPGLVKRRADEEALFRGTAA